LLPVSISLPLKEPSLGVLLYKVGLFRGGAIVDNFIGRCGGGRRRRWKDGEVVGGGGEGEGRKMVKF
jgi:hypothetical protein